MSWYLHYMIIVERSVRFCPGTEILIQCGYSDEFVLEWVVPEWYSGWHQKNIETQNATGMKVDPVSCKQRLMLTKLQLWQTVFDKFLGRASSNHLLLNPLYSLRACVAGGLILDFVSSQQDKTDFYLVGHFPLCIILQILLQYLIVLNDNRFHFRFFKVFKILVSGPYFKTCCRSGLFL